MGRKLTWDEEMISKLETQNRELRKKLKEVEEREKYLAKWKKSYEDAEYIKEGVQGG